ncbi:MAG: hypothetical protein RI568_12845, partial [Natronomonas sp.]|uniref:STT3 domain-containing protein n=1 Tax=Natronomonas sp. TaxID=2184060 RepID=UPI00286FCA94
MNASEIRSLFSDDPELETALEALLEVDHDHETWTFDDVPLDSGVFGELVSEGVVEKVDGEYRLADPDAVERALSGEVDAEDADDSGGVEFSMPEVDVTAAGLLGLVLAVTVAVRIANYSSVFRDRVVFTGNDPYFYVYLVEQGLQNDWSFSALPGGVARGEPLTVVQLLYAAEFAGGLGSHTAILAWMPVLVAVATVAIVYLFAAELTADRRIALASAFGLAVIPVHVTRTSLGFVDHHAFDYFWIVVAAWGVTVTLGLDEFKLNGETIKGIGLLGIGVAGQVLAWQAGALLIAPIGLAAVFGGFVAVRENESFLAPGIATAVGVGIGSLLVAVAHVTWGWHDRLVVAIPIALFGGTVVVSGVAQLSRRFSLPSWTVPTASLGTVSAATLAVYVGRPEWWATIRRELRRLAGIGSEDIVEAQSIFSTTTMGWLLLFGLILLFAIPYMAWGAAVVYRGDRRWAGVTAYAWFTLALAVSLSRFAGELSPFLAIFAGVGLVHVAAWIDAAEQPVPFGGEDGRLTIPEAGTALRILALVGLIFGLSVAMAPVSASNLGFGDDQYGAAAFIDQHAEANGYEYPESYVFSPWSWN